MQAPSALPDQFKLFEDLQQKGATQPALPVGQWIASSLLQKAIRRGDADMAASSAATLLATRGAGLWRRLAVIAFEDIGAGSADTVALTVTACTDPNWRQRHGGDPLVAEVVARMLAMAPKDRSADYLMAAAQYHPNLEGVRFSLSTSTVAERIDLAEDQVRPLAERATAAYWAAVDRKGGYLKIARLTALLGRICTMPLPLTLAVERGAQITREPITLALPLIWPVVMDERANWIEQPLPQTRSVHGVPLYAFDLHTRVGRSAIDELVKENKAIRECLKELVPHAWRRKAAYLAAFYTDASPIGRRLDWSQSESIEALGIAADFYQIGVGPGGISPLLRVFKSNLEHLNAIRSRVFSGWGSNR